MALFDSSGNKVTWSPRVGVIQALREINNKTDGVADDVLPHTQIEFAYYDSRCSASDGMAGALSLTRTAFRQPISAIIGTSCSEASVSAARVAALEQIPLISPSATASLLSNGK
eukprot:4233696-Prymnesium_polylepis.1